MISIFEFATGTFYALFVVVVFLLWYTGKSTFDYWRKVNVVYKKPSLYLGNLADFALGRKTMPQVIDEMYRFFDQQPFGGIWQMRQPTLFVKDVELVHNVLVKDFKYFYDRGFDLFVNVNKELNPLSGHLFVADGERWRVLRQKMSPVFTSGKLKQMHEQINDCIRTLNGLIESKFENNSGGDVDVNLKELFERLTIDVIGTCAFGLACNSMNANDEFRKMGTKVFAPRVANIVKMTLAAVDRRLVNWTKIRDMAQDVNEFFLGVVLNTISYRRRTGTTRVDVLQMLMDLQNTHNDAKYAVNRQPDTILKDEQFDEIDVAANSFLFFVAGFETTASTLSYCLYELSLNQTIQDKVRTEVEQIRHKYQNLESDALKELTYMELVIKETLRKYPPVPMLSRECTEDYAIPNSKVKIRAGTKVLIPTWSIHHDYRYYPNPEVFDPDRFSPENVQKRPHGTYMPFGDGPRYCLGKRFADLEIKAALGDVILKYDFSPCNKTDIPLRFAKRTLVIQPINGIWVKISKRKV